MNAKTKSRTNWLINSIGWIKRQCTLIFVTIDNENNTLKNTFNDDENTKTCYTTTRLFFCMCVCDSVWRMHQLLLFIIIHCQTSHFELLTVCDWHILLPLLEIVIIWYKSPLFLRMYERNVYISNYHIIMLHNTCSLET